MATVTQVMRTCDVCGNAKDVQTWTFGLDSKTYEIDLCPKDGKDLGKVAAGYISKARQTAAKQGRRHGGRGQRSRATTAATSDRPRASQKESSGRSRVTGSSQGEAKTSRSQRRAEEASGAGANAAGSDEKAKPSRSRPQKARTASRRAAKATGPQQEKGVYVYGILPADIEVAPGQPGVGEHPGPLRVVRADGLAALISEVGPSGLQGSPDDLRTYREILDATATEVPVLPLRFGTVLTSEDAVVEELLAAHHDEFADALEQLEGCAEFRVKGHYVEADGHGEVNARREEDTRALEQVMEGVCVASVVREPAHERDAVDVAFLVAASEEDEMERVIEDLAREWEGLIDVQLIGPMAAYDFTGTAKLEN